MSPTLGQLCSFQGPDGELRGRSACPRGARKRAPCREADSRSVSQNSAACVGRKCIGHECRMLRMDIHLTTPDSVDMLRAPAGIGMARCSPDKRSGRAPRPAGQTDSVRSLPRKEVIQPHLPVRLPCYDFTPITSPTFDGSLPKVGSPASGVARFRGVTGGVYKARERIHRGVADPRLLATPPSWRRVSASNPNRDRLYGIRSTSRYRSPLYRPM